MLSKVLSAAIVGLDEVPIEMEIDIAAQGLLAFTIVYQIRRGKEYVHLSKILEQTFLPSASPLILSR